MVTDTAKVIHLEPEVQRHIRARLARLPAGVHGFLDAGKKLFTESLATFFDSADDALFELADRATSNQEQNLYFDSMREVRVQRKSIEGRFLDTIEEAFARLVGQDERDALKNEGELSPEALSLVQNEDLEQLVAFETTVAKAIKQFSAHISFAASRINVLVPAEVNDKNYPFGPFVLCAAAMAQIKRLDVDIKAKMALFTLFDETVIQDLDSSYSQLTEVLNGSRFAAGKASKFAKNPVSSSSSARREQQIHAQSSSAKISTDLLEVLTFVQKLPFKGSVDNGIDIQRVLETVQQHKGRELQLSRLELETINLVQKMFRYILNDYEFAQPFRELVCRLQVPVLKTALVDEAFLQDKRHSARKFLNEFVAAAFEWSGSAKVDESDALFGTMESCVAQISAHRAAHSEVYKAALADFSSFLDNEKKRSAVLEKRTIDAEDGKARAEQARKTVANEVKSRTMAYRIPEVVRSLIEGPWSNVIFVTGFKYGQASREWDEQLNVLSDLVWSVQPCASKADRQKLIRMIPDLLTRLRRGLDAISYNPFEVSELFKGLEEVHLARIRGQARPEDAGPVETAAQDTAQEPVQESVTEAEPPSPSHSAAAESSLAEDDPDMRAVALFTQGAWFDFLDAEQDTLRCRLAAFIKPTGKYIFVNRSGSKVAEKSQQELALMRKNNALRTVDNAMLFDKALESVVTGLRKKNNEMPLDRE